MRRSWLMGIVVIAVVIPACRLTDVTLWQPAEPPPDACAVQHIENVPYRDGVDGDRDQSLDLFLPRGLKDYPVVVLVHGGAWMTGDNRACGLYTSVGEFLASHGIGAVLPNYRLSPGVKHPSHVRDIARAFAWTHAHIAEYGGSPDRMFLVGHSAGGHLVSLLTTDERYLKAEGLSTETICGTVCVSGVYRIPEGDLEIQINGDEKDSLRVEQFLPIRGASREKKPDLLQMPGLPLKLNFFKPVFGNDPVVRRDASPVCHVRPGLPPFLLLSAEHDLPTLPDSAVEFYKSLRERGCEAELHRIPRRNHNSIIFCQIEEDDPVGRYILGFIQRRSGTAGER